MFMCSRYGAKVVISSHICTSSHYISRPTVPGQSERPMPCLLRAVGIGRSTHLALGKVSVPRGTSWLALSALSLALGLVEDDLAHTHGVGGNLYVLVGTDILQGIL